ncbi:transposase [Bacillus timonensis]|uniref:transposase n=1 Tax=Bacillus timonensis TaxID=1033734 RepID=UPI0024160D87|nr:transposase [Bacillus timonensis]
MLRGINRQTIFEEEEDSFKFLETLKRVKDKCDFEIYAYCLMGNHVHLLIKEGNEEIGNTIRRLGASFVYWYNLKYERNGHLFQDRFKSEVVEDLPNLLNVIRYIHQNPLKAGMADDISSYLWSSYREYIGKSRIIEKDFILKLLHTDKNKALIHFRTFHMQESQENHLEITDQQKLTDTRATEIIRNICNVEHCLDLQKISNPTTRDTHIKNLKSHGLSIRQIARLTGISRKVISKA